MFQLVFLDPFGNPAGKPARRTDCITVSPLQAGTPGVFSVMVKNEGPDDCPLFTVQFFLKTPNYPCTALPSHLCSPPSNPPPCDTLPAGAIAAGACFPVTVTYAVQPGDVGDGTVYAQIQTVSPPPGLDPTDMNQTYNAEINVHILALGGAMIEEVAATIVVNSSP